MATYTLSYTGAEVNSAIGNAKDLFSTVHNWTAEQTFSQNITVDGLAYINGHLYLDNDLTVTNGVIVGAYKATADVDMDGYDIDNVQTINAQNITVTGDVTVSGMISGSITANDDLNMNNFNITGANEVVLNRITLDQQIGFVYSGTGIASAPFDGFYINSDGTITRFRTTGPIPASVLVVYFY